ncbi:hypothetical protein DSO57_1001459 [Entomophthora muscae]|uniref:Uncharacterized protein n=1 Tax=Entomophthora muscae TaxID=34485 RepID=A0ACC2UIL7_9FUNG|nr:hypothetical protein DSO57_1001459 [Entomophthora muscae]
MYDTNKLSVQTELKMSENILFIKQAPAVIAQVSATHPASLPVHACCHCKGVCCHPLTLSVSQPACTRALATIYPVSQLEDFSPAHSHQPPSQQAVSCSSTPAG